VLRESRQSTLSIGDVRRRHAKRTRQSLRIHRDMSLDSRYLLPGVVDLLFRRVRVLNALRIND